jgi:hypothetical protein
MPLPAASAVAAGVPAAQEDPRQAFLQRVDDYVALHRRVEAQLPPQVVTSDLDALLAPRPAMVRAMRKARPAARQGDIFTPSVAAYFRTTIGGTLQRHRITDLLDIIEEENTVHTPPAVNGEYPAGRAIPPMPPCLLAALPRLPEEVQYSFIGADLILWDLHAGMIVDYVPRVLPMPTGPCSAN